MWGGRVRRWRDGLAAAAIFVAAGAISPALADPNAVLVVDGSNSMNSRMESGTRLTVLQGAVSRTVPAFAGRLNLGLVAFGNRQELSCRDIQTIVPPDAGAAAKTAAAVRSVAARGVSALANAVRKAATEISYRERSGSIIVIADSAGVANCRVDTCGLARELVSEAAGLKIHMIALAAKDEEIPSLQCMATTTGGSFARVTSSSGLTTALTAAFTAAAASEAKERPTEPVPPPRAKPAAPAQVAAATPQTVSSPEAAPAAETAPVTAAPVADAAAPVTEAAGGAAIAADPNAVPPPRPKPGSGPTTRVTAAAPSATGDGSQVNESVFAPTASITAGDEPELAAASQADVQQTSETVMAPSAGAVSQQPDSPPTATLTPVVPGGAVDAGEPATTRVASRGEFQVSDTAPSPSGTTTLVRRLERSGAAKSAPATSNAEPQRTSALQATESPQPAGEGRAKLSGYVVEGTKPIPSGIKWQLAAAGSGEVVATSSDPSPEVVVPAGRYEVRALFGNARGTQTVDVKPGTTASADVVLDAGGLQIIPLNAGGQEGQVPVSNTIFPQGDNRNPVASDTKSGAIIYLNAGTYRVESRYGNAVATATITVQPGKLVKAKINHRAGPAAFRLVPEGGGQPLSGTLWQVRGSDGNVITESREATPALVFAEGNYDVVVQHGDKTYRSAFVIRPGQPTDVEVIAR